MSPLNRKVCLLLNLRHHCKLDQRLSFEWRPCISVCMKRTHVFLPEPMLRKLRDLANSTDLSVAELIRRAIEDYLRRRK
jgi:hypothetical protein